MYAFGLEEAGQYDKAEEFGMSAIAVHPDDVWAIHAVVHSFEMRGLVDRGIPFTYTIASRTGVTATCSASTIGGTCRCSN